ncbi:MAG: ABC transporter permease, partial [Oscillospiraceae bacterium]|nr:ABC transporter permease [Oscillospiraceae bacterium]
MSSEAELESVSVTAGGGGGNNGQEYSLSDDRRVKVLSPGALVARRFFRNRLAVVGLSMLVAIFLFSFLGGVISPYREDQQFYTYTNMNQEYVGVVKNDDLRYIVADGEQFGSILQSQLLLATINGSDSFTYQDVTYQVEHPGEDLYIASRDGKVIAVAAKDIVNDMPGTETASFELKLAALTAYVT